MEKYGDATEAEIVSTTGKLEDSCERLGHKLREITLTEIEERMAQAVESADHITTRFSQSATAAAHYGVRLAYADGAAVDIVIIPREAK